jgi:hypothetical protein
MTPRKTQPTISPLTGQRRFVLVDFFGNDLAPGRTFASHDEARRAVRTLLIDPARAWIEN